MMMLKHFPFFDFELGFGIEFFFLNSFNKSFAKIISLLENLQTKKKVIPIVSIYAQEEDMVWDLTLDREDMEETLSKNLEIMEKFEDYERCQEIVNGIKFIQSKNNNGNKTKNKR